jgi:hypothetical protein
MNQFGGTILGIGASARAVPGNHFPGGDDTASTAGPEAEEGNRYAFQMFHLFLREKRNTDFCFFCFFFEVFFGGGDVFVASYGEGRSCVKCAVSEQDGGNEPPKRVGSITDGAKTGA